MISTMEVSSGHIARWDDISEEKKDWYFPEKYLAGIVTDYLDSVNIEFTLEGRIYSVPIDILCVQRDTSIAIELKSRNRKRGINQALRNADLVDYSFLAVWESNVTQELIDRIDETPVGLLAVDSIVKCVSPPSQTTKQLCPLKVVREAVMNDV